MSSLFRKVDDKKVYQYIYQCMIRLVAKNARRDKASKGWIVTLGAKEDGCHLDMVARKGLW